MYMIISQYDARMQLNLSIAGDMDKGTFSRGSFIMNPI